MEADRTTTRDGIVSLAGHELALGPEHRNNRVMLRIEDGLIHAIIGDHLVKTLPSPLRPSDHHRIRELRRATGALPPPPAAGPQRVHRRVPKDGVTMVAGQRLRVGRTHAGRLVTILVEDHHFRVIDGPNELGIYARTTSKPLRNYNAPRKATPENETSNMN